MEPTGLSMRWAAVLALMFAVPLARGADAVKLDLVATIEMPNVKGRIDHLGVDVAGHRVFVAALGNDTVEVLDTAQNRHERSIKGFGEPQGLLYLPDTGRLYAANGTSARLDVIDAATFQPVSQVKDLDDADNVRHDAASGAVVVGYGTGSLRILDARTGASKGDIRLAGHPESFQLERGGTRIFVNVPTAAQVAVVDRAKAAVIATWRVSALANYPMALDEKGRRLFVGTRMPARLLVYDIDSGRETAKVEIGGDTDDVFFDAERGRLYVICGEGQVDVLREQAPGRYVRESSVKTAARARTGLFVPEDGKLYVAAPASGGAPARMMVYAIR